MFRVGEYSEILGREITTGLNPRSLGKTRDAGRRVPERELARQ